MRSPAVCRVGAGRSANDAARAAPTALHRTGGVRAPVATSARASSSAAAATAACAGSPAAIGACAASTALVRNGACLATWAVGRKIFEGVAASRKRSKRREEEIGPGGGVVHWMPGKVFIRT